MEGGASKNGSSSGDENSADQFAKSDRNTLKKIRNDETEAAEMAAVRRNVIKAKGRVPVPKPASNESSQN